MLSAFRNPRKRRISVGPQSEADAREFIANREQRRRNDRSGASPHSRKPRKLPNANADGTRDVLSPLSKGPPERPSEDTTSANSNGSRTEALQVQPVEKNLLTPPASEPGVSGDRGREDENNDRKMFSALEKPRTHYDAEVITKLVVYTGKCSCIVLSHLY